MHEQARKKLPARQPTRDDLLFPELSYQVTGIVFTAFKQLGYGYQEKYYQRAVELGLRQADLRFQREAHVPITINNQTIGRYFIDFVVNDQIVLELKVANELYETHVAQVLAYLRTTGLRLGLLATITPRGVKMKRIVV